MTDPIVVKAANLTIPPGSRIENVIKRMSLTSGKERNDESHMARTMRPIPPYGSRVFLSQIEIASKLMNYLGNQRPKSGAIHARRIFSARPNA